MALDPQEFLTTIKERFLFTQEDIVILQTHADWGKEIASAMADHFYDYLTSDEEMNAILNADEGRLQRLHQTFISWFSDMFTGIDNWESAYAQSRWRIGIVHVKVGIGPQHVVPAMAKVISEVGKLISKNNHPPELFTALNRICMIDLAFLEQAYVEVSSKAVLSETGWSEKLFKRLVSAG
ncbi:MAG: hypothetical protein F6K24_37145, partial [Okeania sp. SIO2D1]|nr:hypothetical protein [Okeania sp. SIO2D1]